MQHKRPIDWHALAIQTGSIQPGERLAGGGTLEAQAALAVILGEEEIRRAVDLYVKFPPEAELILSVLKHLRPAAAAQRCVEIYREAEGGERGFIALGLLKEIVDHENLDLVPWLLAEPYERAHIAAANLLFELLWLDKDLEACEGLLNEMQKHSNWYVRRKAYQMLMWHGNRRQRWGAWLRWKLDRESQQMD